jgi:UDP-GlcNAc:undecaprenyl-phosphate GlcNAc-1-phosphate transferase
MILDSSSFALLFLAATISSLGLTGVMRKIALKFNVIDQPNQSHKTHSQPVPYLGGLAIIITVDAIALLGTYLLNTDSKTKLSVLSIIIPATFMGVVGLIDDVKRLSPFPRFIAQTITGVFTAVLISATDTIGNPLSSQVLNFIITVLWIVGITNAVNFFDNIDGGAAGFVVISCLGLFFLSLQNQQSYIAALSMLLAGATLGFLFWNFHPAKIYLGDTGALFLGVLISATLIRFEPNTSNRLAGFAIPLLLTAVIVMDTTVAVVSRLVRRVSPFKGGRDHLSHRLLAQGFSRVKSVALLWGMCILFALTANLIAVISEKTQLTLIFSFLIIWLMLFSWFIRQSPRLRATRTLK